MNQKISVIVPIYNVEQYLNRCIESIVNQTYRNLEIILVDDGSPDNCPKICDEWAEKDNRIKVIHKENGGLSDARNAGMKIATGDFIAFVDSDDWTEIQFIEKLYNALLEYDCDIAGCKYRKCEKVSEIKDNPGSNQVEIYNKIDGLSSLISETIKQVVWNKLYKKDVIEGIAFEKGKYHEDEFWSYQIFARSKQYVEIDYVGYNYFQRETSIMGEKYSLKRLDAVEAKVFRQRFLEEQFPMLVFQGKVNLWFSCLGNGQAAITRLKMNEKEYAISYLKTVIQDNKISRDDYKGLKLTHKVWLKMARHAFVFTCRMRQMLRVGI